MNLIYFMYITGYNAVSLTIMIRHLRRIIVLTKLHERGEYITLTSRVTHFIQFYALDKIKISLLFVLIMVMLSL
jgi:hypothetical protein